MGQDFFKYLPSEMTINILSRLPVVTTVCCKCVCKPWLALIESPEFVKSHLSKSVLGLAVFRDYFYGLEPWENPYVFYKFVDKILTHWCSADFNFNLPHHQHINSSVNGLLLLSDQRKKPREQFVCNPITRDYIKLPLLDMPSSNGKEQQGCFGFGVSKMSGEYKVVRIYHEPLPLETVCNVYTLGTGSWRSVVPRFPFRYLYETEGTFVNGNLHWQICDLCDDDSCWISCFDLETELFSIFSLPPNLHDWDTVLTALDDSLVLSDTQCNEEEETVFWFMDTYGDDKSWTRDCFGVVRGGVIYPLKVFKDGDILMAQCDSSKIFYSKVPEIYDRERDSSYDIVLHEYDRICGVSYTPRPELSFTQNLRIGECYLLLI